MKIIKPSFEILNEPSFKILRSIERAGRICYKSERETTFEECKKFIADRIKAGHESILEHEKITVKFVCDRGVSHELVRHRLASYSQESTRYCKYGDGLTFIKPCFWDENSIEFQKWKELMSDIERLYIQMIHTGSTPQEARAILPNSLKTEVIMTANLREWRHILKLRTAPDAHPQMREFMCPLLKELKEFIPVVFDDIIGR